MRKGKKGKEEVGSICKGNGSGGGNAYPVNRGILLKAAPQLKIMLLKGDAQRLYGMPVVGEWGWGTVVASVTSIQDVRRPSGITTYFVGPRYPQFSS